MAATRSRWPRRACGWSGSISTTLARALLGRRPRRQGAAAAGAGRAHRASAPRREPGRRLRLLQLALSLGRRHQRGPPRRHRPSAAPRRRPRPPERRPGEPGRPAPGSVRLTLPRGGEVIEESRFDPETGRDEGLRTVILPGGRRLSAGFSIRYHGARELEALAAAASFSSAGCFLARLDRRPRRCAAARWRGGSTLRCAPGAWQRTVDAAPSAAATLPQLTGVEAAMAEKRKLPHPGGQARPRRPRPRREDHRPRPARRGLRGHLHRAAPDPGDDRRPRRSRRTSTRSASRSCPART